MGLVDYLHIFEINKVYNLLQVPDDVRGPSTDSFTIRNEQ